MQPSKLNQRPDMNANISAKTEPPRNLNRELYALQDLAERLAKVAAELDNSTQCVRLAEPLALSKECPPPDVPTSNVTAILKGLYDNLSATHNRLCTILRELDFDFPPGP